MLYTWAIRSDPMQGFRTTIVNMLAARIAEAMRLLPPQDITKMVASFECNNQRRMIKRFDKLGITPTNRNIAFYIALQIESGARSCIIDECNRINVPCLVRDGTHFMSLYSNLTYQIADAFRDRECELIRAILDQKIAATLVAAIAFQDITKLCPSILQEEKIDLELRRQQKIEQKTSKAFKCKKCKASETTMQEMQTRSSDEAPTLLLQCVNCGNRWRQ